MHARRLSPSVLALCWALCLAPAALRAQDAPVYRCGNTYQAKPCAGGVVVDAADPRSEAQRREAEAARKRDATLARQMAADRRAAERDAARGGGAANVGPVVTAASAKPAASSAKSRKKPKTVKLKPAKAPRKAKAVKQP